MSEMAGLFKALGDETRLRILKLLEPGELCVCDMVAAIGSSQPKISFHLSTLKAAGLITGRKVGKWSHYSISPTDLMRRFVLQSALERLEGDVYDKDRKRLDAFVACKGDGLKIKPSCCG